MRMIDSMRLLLTGALFAAISSYGQTVTTQNLSKEFDNSFSLFFYKNTLRMYNMAESKEFDDLVKDIEKMKFLVIDKEKSGFAQSNYRKLTDGYKNESYEPIVTSRHQGKSFDVYMKERNGKTLGTVVLVNDSTNLYVLDILGSIDVQKASKLFSSIEENSEVGKQFKSFLDEGNNHKKKDGKLHIN